MHAILKLVFFATVFVLHGHGLPICDCQSSCVVNNVRSSGGKAEDRSCDSIIADSQCDPKGQRPFRDFQKEVKTSTFCGEVCVPFHEESKLCSQQGTEMKNGYNLNTFEYGQSWQNRGDIESLVKTSSSYPAEDLLGSLNIKSKNMKSKKKDIETRVGEEKDSSLDQIDNPTWGIWDVYDKAFVGDDYGDEGEDDDSDIDIYIDNAFVDQEDETAASFTSLGNFPHQNGTIITLTFFVFCSLYFVYTFFKSKQELLSSFLLEDFQEL